MKVFVLEVLTEHEVKLLLYQGKSSKEETYSHTYCWNSLQLLNKENGCTLCLTPSHLLQNRMENQSCSVSGLQRRHFLPSSFSQTEMRTHQYFTRLAG